MQRVATRALMGIFYGGHGPDLHPRLIWHGHGQWRNDGRAASSAR
ncbi:hypothetical protein [Limnohabitans sp.]